MDQKIKKNLLLSAYACDPFKGSEPGVAWDHVYELIKRNNYFITIVTRKKNVKKIIKKLTESEISRIIIVGVDLPSCLLWWKRGHIMMHIYYYIWQILAFFKAKSLHNINNYNIAHHLSFMTIRTNMIPFLGIPSIVGPVGGAQLPPRGFGKILKHTTKEALRSLSIVSMKYSPIWRTFIKRVSVLIVANKDNLWIVPEKYRDKTIVRQVGWKISDKYEFNECKELSNILHIYWGGRMIGWKGLEILIRALPKLSKKYPNFMLDITGEGQDYEYYKSLVQAIGVAPWVTFHGWVDEDAKINLQKSSDIYVFTSLHETTGTALFEMMSLRKPIISIDHAGPGEILNDHCALMIDVKNGQESSIDKCFENLEKLMNDEKLRIKMGTYAYERLENYYEWSCYIDELENLYRSIEN